MKQLKNTIRNQFQIQRGTFLVVSAYALFGWFAMMPSRAAAQDVSAQVSTREAWVGSPIVLQIQIANANSYELPELIELDGCDIRSAGVPSQSSQITIINGRRSESRRLTARFLITPRREGRFEIPALEIKTNGKSKTTQPISFVANQSETGDLLFVEVEGKRESVFVGESLDLKLSIWVKPFADRVNQIKLSEGQMWQMISGETSWGSFSDRLQELAGKRQRPAGETVLRVDESGGEREYYKYEINATVNPTKPGKIDSSDLQIVMDYPLALGRGRDPFDSFFEDGAMGGSNLLQQMMGDEFFSSPFGRRLTITDSRPVVAEASVNSTLVIPIPRENQPADYRGAVGRYKIVTEAGPKNVTSGDPITLRIGVVGDGPMELVQAPPLNELQELISDFQVTDQSLAGFVQADTKVFVTTIRPRHEDVTLIPAIPFSYFDPQKKGYETVYSKPINITVEKAESLGFDAIVSGSHASPNAGARGAEAAEMTAHSLDFSNDFSTSVLESDSPPSRIGWLYFAVLPPLGWLAVVTGQWIRLAFIGGGLFRSLRSAAIAQVEKAKRVQPIEQVLRRFIELKTGSDSPTNEYAVGAIRNLGAYQEASEFESLLNQLEQFGRRTTIEESSVGLSELKMQAVELIERLNQAIDQKKRRGVSRRSARKDSKPKKLTVTLLGFILFGASTTCCANEFEFPSEQMETILDEANQSYQAGMRLIEEEPAKARELFGAAADRYQTLVDQGVRNSRLFCNLGNAWSRSGDAPKAILNYHRALWINPNHTLARRNLGVIQKQRSELNSSAEADWSAGQLGLGGWRSLDRWIGFGFLQIIFAVSSAVFWLLLTVKTVRRHSPLLRWMAMPLLLMILSGWSLSGIASDDAEVAVITASSVQLKSGDGYEFETERSISSTAGQTIEVIATRASWAKVRLADGSEGWLPADDLAFVCLES